MKLQPPLIGITCASQRDTGNFYLPSAYVNAVRLAGGLPILLPPGEPNPAAILERIDGIIFSGGGDINPAVYNGSLHPTIYNIDPLRDDFELALAKLVLNTEMPVLGICRGLEVLVVASGGDLIPHVPDEFGESVIHRLEQLRPAEHRVQITCGSCLGKIIGKTDVNIVSWHHQAVRNTPKGWRVTAHASDGVIEALEHEQHPWAIAVQWHPELSIDDPDQQSLFRAFVTTVQNRTLAFAQK